MIFFMILLVLLVLMATGFLGGFVSRCGTFTQLVGNAFLTAFFPQLD